MEGGSLRTIHHLFNVLLSAYTNRQYVLARLTGKLIEIFAGISSSVKVTED